MSNKKNSFRKQKEKKRDTILQNSNKSTRTEIYLVIFCIISITSLTFSPTTKNGFTNWDDDIYVTQNPLIKELSPQGILKIFSSIHKSGNYHPLTLLSLAVEYKIVGLSPALYHINNILLHIINALLVFLLIYLFSKQTLISFITSILFAIHPLRVESVAWVTERKDLLYSIFYLGGLILYFHYLKTSKTKYYFLALISFIMSLLSKSMAVTFPIILLIIEYYFHNQKIDKKTLLEKFPFFIIAFLFGIITIYAQKSVEAINIEQSKLLLDRIMIAAYGLLFYVYKIFIPINLSCLYPYQKPFPIQFILSPFLLIFFVAAFIYFKIFSKKKIMFGLSFAFITILPVLQLIPVGSAIAADRYTYIPSIGIFYLLAEGFHFLYTKKYINDKNIKSVLIVILIIIFLTLSSLSYHQCFVWRDSISLWNDAIKKFPAAETPYNNRANAFIDIGEFEKSLSDLSMAIQINPNNPQYYYNRGLAYSNLGQYDKSLADYNTAIEKGPNIAKIYNNRGNVYIKIGDNEKALEDFNTAINLNPQFAEALNNRANISISKGEYNAAVKDLDEAIKINPNYTEAYYNRGLCYHNLNEFEKALNDYTKTLTLNPNQIKAYNNRGGVYVKMKEYEKAISDFNNAISINSNYLPAYVGRGSTYLTTRQFENALSDFTKALSINPDYALGYVKRAETYIKINDYDAAYKDIKRAEELGGSIKQELIDELNKLKENKAVPSKNNLR